MSRPATSPDEQRAQLARLAAIVESSGDALYGCDLRGRLTSWNKGAQALYGYPARAMIGRPIFRLWPKSEHGTLRKVLRSVARGQAYRNPRDRRVARDGREIPVSAAMFPIRDGSGRVVGVAVVSRDISAEARAAEADRLRESERLQREFVANVSHELRTPVAAIRGFAETLLQGALDDPRSRRSFVAIIEKHAFRLSALIEDLLVLSLLESGRRPPRKKPAALEPLIRRCCAGLSPLLRGKALTLKISAEPGLRAAVDPGQFDQVLQNLLSNAIKFSRRGGLIGVSARALGRHALVSVSDTGRGIPAERLPTIFQRFNRVERRGPAGGTGLGLSIAKEIVLAHGGRIWAESERGKGAAFHLTLPRPGKR